MCPQMLSISAGLFTVCNVEPVQVQAPVVHTRIPELHAHVVFPLFLSLQSYGFGSHPFVCLFPFALEYSVRLRSLPACNGDTVVRDMLTGATACTRLVVVSLPLQLSEAVPEGRLLSLGLTSHVTFGRQADRLL